MGVHTNGCLCCVCGIELDDASTAGAAIGLVLDLGTVDLANGGEQINQVIVAGRPGQLSSC